MSDSHVTLGKAKYLECMNRANNDKNYNLRAYCFPDYLFLNEVSQSCLGYMDKVHNLAEVECSKRFLEVEMSGASSDFYKA